jgi:hypothetical protein
MSGSAEPLVNVVLLSSIASADQVLEVGAIVAMRAAVAAAWIADGLARPVDAGATAVPETTLRESGRARKAPR